MTGSDKKTICTFVMSDVSRYNEVRKEMEVLEMFRHKAEKRIVELNSEQLRLAKYALLEFRNKLIAQGKPTEDVNELLLKIMKYYFDSRRDKTLRLSLYIAVDAYHIGG